MILKHFILSCLSPMVWAQLPEDTYLGVQTESSPIENRSSEFTELSTQEAYVRNVTFLLDGLLENYDKRIRPHETGGGPTYVYIDLMVRSMGPISEREMTYSMDCYFRQTWNDGRLQFESETRPTLSLGVAMLDKIWKPDTYFANGLDSYLHLLTTPNKFVRLSQDGTVHFSSRLTVKAKCPMYLRKFPLDAQKCPLHIGSFAYNASEIVYEWKKGANGSVAVEQNQKLSQFTLEQTRIGQELLNTKHIAYDASEIVYEWKKGANGSVAVQEKRLAQFTLEETRIGREFVHTKHSEFSVLHVDFVFQRHAGYFLINFYGPCTLIVILSWVAFWINREATADRIGLGVTSMLTMTFLFIDSRSDLPRVSYPTALDVYLILCFVFVMLSILEFSIVHAFTKYKTADPELQYLEKERLDMRRRSLRCKKFVTANPGAVDSIPCNGRLLESYLYDPLQSRPALPSRPVYPRSKQLAPMPLNFRYFNNFAAFYQPRLSWLYRWWEKWKADGKKADPNDTEVNSVSRIDRWSRTFFPLIFALISVAYWRSFLTEDKSQ